MANRFYSPNQQFADATGAPYAGGSLAFYASGTSTPLATYSDSALTIANTNPVVLDSAGRAGNIFLQNLAYKVVLSDVNNNVIWTDDPVYSSDFSARAKLLSGAGSPNGVVAGTAGSASIGADTYWDTTNNILYVCTQTGTSSTAVWTAINSASAAAVVLPPQGYLTPVSGTPIITSDSIAATQIYYTPYIGNTVPIYNGASFVPTVFSELSLALAAQHAASTIYDVFVFNNSGVLTLVTGPAWSSSTAGSGARGTGAGTTQLSLISGLLVNTVSITGRNGATTYSIPASQAKYLGSIFIDTSVGQVTCHRSYGQSRKWGIWNAYNRQPIYMIGGDGTGSWPYTTNTIRAANGNSANSISTFTGLPEESFDLSTTAYLTGTTLVNQSIGGQVGIGSNSTTTFSGKAGSCSFVNAAGSSTSNSFSLIANYKAAPSLGVNVITALENGTANVAPQGVWNGSQTNMLLSATYRG